MEKVNKVSIPKANLQLYRNKANTKTLPNQTNIKV